MLCVGAVAFFVFFAGAAWTGVVAADFFSDDSLSGSGVLGGADGAGLFQLATLLALELFFQLVDGGGWGAGVDGDGGVFRAGLL